MIFPYLHHAKVPRAGDSPRLIALAAELRRDVEVLATDIGPRGTHSPKAYRLAEQFLTTSLAKTGRDVRRHAVTVGDAQWHNLEIELPGTTHPERIVIVGAHYDSVPDCPAANDNGSGVAGVLALARVFAARAAASTQQSEGRLPCTIRFVLFVNEEPPFFNFGEMGSQLYAQACRQRHDNITAMFCLETIGCYSTQPGSQKWPDPGLDAALPSIGDFIVFVGPDTARGLIKQATTAFESAAMFPILGAAVPPMFDQINWSDHRGFNEAGYPGFMVTDTAPFRYPHYHCATDTAEKLDYGSMARVVLGMERVIESLAAG